MDTLFNPELDLQLDCETPLSAEQVWAGWTTPELYPHWFCPRPWVCTEAQLDLRAGGAFATTMVGPEQQVMHHAAGCFLLVEAPRRLIWTNLMGPGFAPVAAPEMGFGFVVELCFTPLPSGGSRYQAWVRHTDRKSRDQHEAMGFDAGWRAALAQLEEHFGAST